MLFARRSSRAPDVAIDLGTAFTRVYARRGGLLADVPSLVRVRPGAGSAEAVGRRASEPGRGVARPPMRAGVIVDGEAATLLLRKLLGRARGSLFARPSVLVCAPSDARPHEVEALKQATREAGACAVSVAPQPLAAAIGSGLDVGSRYTQMVVDVGEGVTDVGVVRSGCLAGSSTLRLGCGALRDAVSAAALRHGVRLRPGEAERLAGEAQGATGDLLAAGTDPVTGLQCCAWVPAREVAEAVEPLFTQVAGTVRSAWRDLTPEASCEVIESGVRLAGGGALIRGLRERIAAATALEVKPAADPLHAVILGARRMMDAGRSPSRG
ncbi:MAG TPA: rod shape-determining protein [Vicinamibacteria bacterium]|nr:rod shape-determining protein [Vicinamibacteria bacterium]